MELLKAALLKSDEAALHGRAASEAALQMWALLRTAGADSRDESMAAAFTESQAGTEFLRKGLAALNAADGGVRGYIAAVAPNHSVKSTGRVAPGPDGGSLTRTVRARPKLRAFVEVTTREGDDTQDSAENMLRSGQNVKSFLEPPQVTGHITSTPTDVPVVRPVISAPSTDAAGAVLVTGLVVARVVDLIKNRRKRTKER
ncbi:hypothetical protein ACIB24_14745 [Spongisporangium articulatum]|uniref:Uncharacterized protein n=1 Tax=Spongisporangium articulatum TaxID=3362603 RepID=A0ABW8APL8_9ACTN